MELTIRERINNYQNEIIKGDLFPERAAEILTEISALLGNINDEMLKRDVEYNKVLLKYLEEEKTANRAKIKADISPEYELMKTARNTEKQVLEMIRSLKYLLRAKTEEYNQGNN